MAGQVCLRTLLVFCATAYMAAAQNTALAGRVEAAQRAQERQDCHTAASEYAQAVQQMPKSGELRSNYGVALYCDDQLTASVAAFRKALSLNPELAAPHLFLGLAAYRLSNLVGAVKELELFCNEHPADITAHLWLGYAYVAQQRYQMAIPQFEGVAQLKPDNMDAQYALGQSYLEVGRIKARELVALDPNGSGVAHLAGEQYQMRGGTERASQAFKVAASREATDTFANAARSAKRNVYNEVHEAEKMSQAAFQTVLERAPGSYRALQIMADILVARQDSADAVMEYRSALAENPGTPGVHEVISRCLMQDGHLGDALEELYAERKLQPRSAQVQTEIGSVQLAMGDETGAIASLREALSRESTPAAAYLLLGKATLRRGDAKSAIPLLQRYLSVDPNSSAAYYLLVRAYRTTGDRQAMADALDAYKRTSHDAEDRQIAEQVTRDPNVARVELDAEEVRDARTLSSSHP